MDEKDLYVSGKKPRSSILNTSFISRLNSLFGYKVNQGEKPETSIEKRYGFKFVRVDLDNSNYKVKNAALGTTWKSVELNTKLEKLFDAWLTETTMSYSDIADRQARLNELSYAYFNDCWISRVVHLTADEATQLDVQDRLIGIESPNINFIERTYELLQKWGITQQCVHKACFDLELYGEAFWANKITLNGVERIKAIPPQDIMERLEFSPTKIAKFLAERDGWQKANKNRASKLQALFDLYNNKDKKAFDISENISDMFDDKLLGYELHDGIIAPPWTITHFRYNADHSEFYPYGRPPLIAALAPFKQYHATMALQGLARQMSFPITVYKVKNTEGMLPAQAYNVVNEVRQEYSNIGVAPSSVGNEIYTVNTQMWIPEGLVDIEVVESKCEMDFVEDLKMYQNRVGYAVNIPMGYIDPNGEGGGDFASGKALMEQYKPFARHVYTIQTAFLQGLGELIRLHYAITGEFDYNTPFILTMRFPAEEVSDDKRNAQKESMELATSVIELLKDVLGISEEDPLPEDVVFDILAKYSFLDPTDVQKWTRLSSFLKTAGKADDEDGGGDDGDFGGFDDVGDDFSGGEDDAGGDDFAVEESYNRKDMLKVKKLLRERDARLKENQLVRMREISSRYKESKDAILFKFVESNNMSEWTNTNTCRHNVYIKKIEENSCLSDVIGILSENKDTPYKKLREELSKTKDKDNVMRLTKRAVNENVDIANEKITNEMKRAAKEARI